MTALDHPPVRSGARSDVEAPTRAPDRGRGHRIAVMVRRRLVVAVPLLVIVSGALFALGSRSPFDPLAGYLDDRYLTMSAADKARVSAELGLDQPWWKAYGQWVSQLVSGDLGMSRSLAQPVSAVVAERLPWTLLLASTGLATAIVVSLVFGVWAGARPGSIVDRVVTALASVTQAVPPFVWSLGAVAFFSLTLGWLPVAGLTDPGQEPTFAQVVRHLVLPAAVLAVSMTPWLLLSVRQSTRAATGSDAVVGARARGIPESVIVRRHILPVALAPFVTAIGLRLPELIVGAAIVEEVFAWPGLAGALVTSAKELDFPLLAVLTVGTTAVVLIGSLLADIAYVLLDPRVDLDA